MMAPTVLDGSPAIALTVLRNALAGDEPTTRVATVLLDALAVLVAESCESTTEPATPSTVDDRAWGDLRRARGWTQYALYRRLVRVAANEGEQLPDWPTFKRNLSRWETGVVVASAFYRRLLMRVYNQPVTEDLGEAAR